MSKKVKFPTIHFAVKTYFTACGISKEIYTGTHKVPKVTCKNCLRKLGLGPIKTSIRAAKARITLEFSDGSTIYQVVGGSESFEFHFENHLEVVPLEKLRDREMKGETVPIRFGFEEKPLEIELKADDEFTDNLRKAVFGEPWPLRKYRDREEM